MIDVANEEHRSCRCFFLFAAGKGAGRHIVLHDLDAIFVLKVDIGNLIERYAVPQADQAHGFSARVVKQIRNGSLATGNKDAVRGDFLVNMGFAGASRTQLAEVEVVLNKRQHTASRSQRSRSFSLSGS